VSTSEREHLDTVPAVRLGSIESSVGVPDQTSRVGGVLREDGDAEARGDARVAFEDAQVSDRRPNPLGHLDGRVAMGILVAIASAGFRRLGRPRPR
jgi:hypothetical protein